MEDYNELKSERDELEAALRKVWERSWYCRPLPEWAALFLILEAIDDAAPILRRIREKALEANAD
jgi:hypothetical protein